LKKCITATKCTCIFCILQETTTVVANRDLYSRIWKLLISNHFLMKKLSFFYSFISCLLLVKRLGYLKNNNNFLPMKTYRFGLESSILMAVWIFFFLCSPNCPKWSCSENSYWKCVSRHICSLICGNNPSIPGFFRCYPKLHRPISKRSLQISFGHSKVFKNI
jgi:hypothetical protein